MVGALPNAMQTEAWSPVSTSDMRTNRHAPHNARTNQHCPHQTIPASNDTPPPNIMNEKKTATHQASGDDLCGPTAIRAKCALTNECPGSGGPGGRLRHRGAVAEQIHDVRHVGSGMERGRQALAVRSGKRGRLHCLELATELTAGTG